MDAEGKKCVLSTGMAVSVDTKGEKWVMSTKMRVLVDAAS